MQNQQELLIACDEYGNPLPGKDEQGRESSKIERGPAHRFGITHLALMFTYKNSENQIYLAKRVARRDDLESQGIPTPFGGFWDASGAGHYRWSELVGNELVDKKARILGELDEEFGVRVQGDRIKLVGSFRYSAIDPNYYGSAIQVQESEVCYLAILYNDYEPRLDTKEVSLGQWVGSEALRKEVEEFMRKHVADSYNGSVKARKTERSARLLTPWFLKAQQTFPEEIYEYRTNAAVSR